MERGFGGNVDIRRAGTDLRAVRVGERVAACAKQGERGLPARFIGIGIETRSQRGRGVIEGWLVPNKGNGRLVR